MTFLQRGLRLAGVVLLVGALAVYSPTAASAADGDLKIDVPGDGEGFVSGPVGAALSFSGLEPGDVETGTVRLLNDSDDSVVLSFQVSDILDNENGCLEPEVNEGSDGSCGADDGELSQWIELTVTRTDGNGDQALWSGRIADLTEATPLSGDMAAGEVWDLDVTAELPAATGNAVMTDEVTFTMAWSARGDQGGVVPGDPESPGEPQQPGQPEVPGEPGAPGEPEVPEPEVAGESDVVGEAEVAGVAAFRPPSDAGAGEMAGVTLPFTGVTVEPWLLSFATVLVLGGGLLMAWSGRRSNLVHLTPAGRSPTVAGRWEAAVGGTRPTPFLPRSRSRHGGVDDTSEPHRD